MHFRGNFDNSNGLSSVPTAQIYLSAYVSTDVELRWSSLASGQYLWLFSAP